MSDVTSDQAVSVLRAFNRFHTRFAGALQPQYMASGMGLTGARLLYEIAQQDGVLAMELQERLGIDAGYASRLLRGFEKQGWIARGRGSDGRQRPIALTSAGRDAFKALDDATRADTAARIAGLGADERTQLIAALATVREILGDKDTAPWHIRPFRTGEPAMVAARQSILYAQSHGWGRALEALEAQVIGEFLRDFKPGREQCWIAERDGRMLGAILLVDAGEGLAKLRLLHVEPEARGLGIGRALVDSCIGFAREVGYDRISLWTHSVLTSARRIYAAAGFVLIATEMHDRFGAPVQGETWELTLKQAGRSDQVDAY